MLPEHVRILDPIWTDRIYANHPRVSLARLQADLADHAHEVLMLTIRLDPRGGWTRKLRNPPERSYSGRVQRILEDLECWLKDDDMRLVERRSRDRLDRRRLTVALSRRPCARHGRKTRGSRACG